MTRIALFALALIIVAPAAGGCASTPEKQPVSTPPEPATSEQTTSGPATSEPDAGAEAIREELPNARVRLKLRFAQGPVHERTIEQTIWMRGHRFRVRDEAGRGLYEILGDVTSPRGLGLPARTLEEMMDRSSAARRPPSGVSEVFGDLDTDVGWVLTPHWPRSNRPAHELLPIVRQVLAGDRTAGLERARSVKKLGREATEFRGTVDVHEDGRLLTNNVVRVVDPPFLLVDDAHDAGGADIYYVREVVALDRDVVTDADLELPP